MYLWLEKLKHLRMWAKNTFFIFSVFLLVAALIIILSISLYQIKNAPDLPNPPLKDLAAKHGLMLGNFAIYSHLNEKPYVGILESQFNLAIIDNTPNWYFIGGGLRPGATTYNFSQMDQIVGFAKKHQMAIQAHHLVWGEEKWLPDWLKNSNYASSQLLNLIHQHINTVVSRYKGQIADWSVVNEAFTRAQHIYGLNDWWAEHTGGQAYIDNSFIWAHQADPSVKLILNDFGNEETNSISNAMYDYIKSAKARGVPIDGLGMQMHIDGTNPPDEQKVIQNMRRFAQIGVQTYMTEFDVNMNDVKGSEQLRLQKEANIYYSMMRACIESGVCHSFAILGITDKETWYNYLGLTNSEPLPFDKLYQPKPAYYSLRTALEQP